MGVLFWWEAQAGYAWWLFGGLGDGPKIAPVLSFIDSFGLQASFLKDFFS